MSAQVSALPTSRAVHPAGKRPNPVWLSPAQVCERVPGLSERILENLRGAGRGPRYFKPSLKTVIYEQGDVDAWVVAHVVSTRDSA